MQSKYREQHKDFRRDETTIVLKNWQSNQSCSLVGVGSAGKTNLLHHLANPNTLVQYLSVENARTIRPIIIDPNLLGIMPDDVSDQMRSFAGYELIMHRLYMAMHPFEMLSEEEANEMAELYRTMSDGRNPLYGYMSLRYLERALDIFFRKNIRIVLMLDEFEELLKRMPTKFFQTLRGLRDANKNHLSYLTFTRSTLPVLVRHLEIDLLEIEPFTELFTDKLLYVGPYSEGDGRRMLETLTARGKNNHPEHVKEFILWSTGRFAGLMRAAFNALENFGEIDASAMENEDIVTRLAGRRAVKEECRTIWTSLTPEEQHILKVAAKLNTPKSTLDADAVTMLINKKLLYVDKVNNILEVKPPLFKAYVKANPEISE